MIPPEMATVVPVPTQRMQCFNSQGYKCFQMELWSISLFFLLCILRNLPHCVLLAKGRGQRGMYSGERGD